MTMRCAGFRAAGFLTIVILCAFAAPEVHADKLPWTLRDHYTFRYGDIALQYAVGNAEWTLVKDGVHLVDDVRPRVELAGGRVLGLEAFKDGKTNRERFENPAGPGIRHIINMESEAGIALEHSLKVQRGHAFFLVEMKITNNTGEPIEVVKLSPAVVEHGGMASLAPATRTHRRPLVARMGYPLVDKNGRGLTKLFEDADKDFLLALGVLPQGVADSGVTFQNENGQWRGAVESAFDPPVTLEPGQSLSADPMWLVFSMPNPADVDRIFSWSHSVLLPSLTGAHALPDAWITVPDGASADSLYDTVESWDLSGVRHAVVPNGWQRELGALQGGAGYPADMGRVATSLQRLGKTPGITLDPLAIGEGVDGAAIEDGGAYWVNPAASAGAAALRQRGADLAGLGFELIVLAESEIPRDVLKAFNLTRTQAEGLARQAINEGAPDAVVIPAPRTALRGDLASWLEAAGSASRLREYGVGVGPIRFEGPGSGELNPAVVTAMAFYGGPIEIATRPDAELARHLANVFPRDNTVGRPLDAVMQAPRVWEAPLNRSGDSIHGSALVVFPGGSAWPLSSIQLDAGAPAKVWRATDGERIDPQAGVIPPADVLTVYGLTATHPRPLLVGALNDASPSSNSINRLTWDESTGTLSGQIRGRASGPAKAYVYVPEPWTLREGNIDSVRRGAPDQNGRLVSFDVAQGRNTSFELTFSRGQ